MKGKILEFSINTNTGVISADNGQRYTFSGAEWKGNISPSVNQVVDFEIDGDSAKGIYLDSVASGEGKNKIVAGLLGIFLGGLGIHKFYLGCSTAGAIMIVVFFLGFILFGLPTIIISLIGFIEGILYIIKSDSDFNRIYVENQKCWF